MITVTIVEENVTLTLGESIMVSGDVLAALNAAYAPSAANPVLTQSAGDARYQVTPIADSDLPDTIARDTEVTAAIGAHAVATDPHGDRGYAASQIVTHAAEAWAHLPIGTVMEFPSNPDVTKFAPLDGRWVTRASCPLLSALWPYPQFEAPLLIRTAPATVAKVLFVPALGVYYLYGSFTTNTIYRTTDLINFTSLTLPASGLLVGLAYVGTRLILTTTTNQYFTSDDGGDNWTARTGPASFGALHVWSTDSTRLCVIPAAGVTAYWTSDGVNWTTSTIAFNSVIELDYFNGQWLALSGSSSATPLAAAVGLGNFSALGAVATGDIAITCAVLGWNGSEYLLITGTSGKAYASSDLITWAMRTLESNNNPTRNGLLWDGTGWIGLAGIWNGRYRSVDGKTWATATFPGHSNVATTGTLLAHASDGFVVIPVMQASFYATDPDSTRLYLPRQVPSIASQQRFVRVDGPVAYP